MEALVWAATMPRSDLAFAAYNLAKFYDDAAIKALQCTSGGQRAWAITYGTVAPGEGTVSSYVDSDHATFPGSRRSASGGAFTWWGRN